MKKTSKFYPVLLELMIIGYVRAVETAFPHTKHTSYISPASTGVRLLNLPAFSKPPTSHQNYQ
ncbi:MAG: hypothetical protein QN819_09690 [Nitrososphaeraceae archaeon]|nr:hypothetical protein [Nitrososphaeraceae archaeon]